MLKMIFLGRGVKLDCFFLFYNLSIWIVLSNFLLITLNLRLKLSNFDIFIRLTIKLSKKSIKRLNFLWFVWTLLLLVDIVDLKDGECTIYSYSGAKMGIFSRFTKNEDFCNMGQGGIIRSDTSRKIPLPF